MWNGGGGKDGAEEKGMGEVEGGETKMALKIGRCCVARGGKEKMALYKKEFLFRKRDGTGGRDIIRGSPLTDLKR